MRPVPTLGLVDRERDVARPRQHFVGVADHRVQVLQRPQALGQPVAVAADVLDADDDVAVRGEILRLGEVRIAVAAGAMRDDDDRPRPAGRRRVDLDRHAAASRLRVALAARQQARSLPLRGRLAAARVVDEVGEVQDLDLDRRPQHGGRRSAGSWLGNSGRRGRRTRRRTRWILSVAERSACTRWRRRRAGAHCREQQGRRQQKQTRRAHRQDSDRQGAAANRIADSLDSPIQTVGDSAGGCGSHGPIASTPEAAGRVPPRRRPMRPELPAPPACAAAWIAP
jgi:hypothetical protein